VSDLCSVKFWRCFDTVRKQPFTTAEDILDTVFQLLKEENASDLHVWPKSVRSLRQRVLLKCGNFWDNVMHTTRIDVSHFRLPGVTTIKFSFVDPIYVWIMQCTKLVQCGHTLVWEPSVLQHPVTGEETYGAGIEFGYLLRSATENLPVEGRVALLNLSWDAGDTVYKSKNVSPICVQVCYSRNTYDTISNAYETANLFRMRNILYFACGTCPCFACVTYYISHAIRLMFRMRDILYFACGTCPCFACGTCPVFRMRNNV